MFTNQLPIKARLRILFLVRVGMVCMPGLIFVAPMKALCKAPITYVILDSSNSKPHYRGCQFHFANDMGDTLSVEKILDNPTLVMFREDYVVGDYYLYLVTKKERYGPYIHHGSQLNKNALIMIKLLKQREFDLIFDRVHNYDEEGLLRRSPKRVVHCKP